MRLLSVYLVTLVMSKLPPCVSNSRKCLAPPHLPLTPHSLYIPSVYLYPVFTVSRREFFDVCYIFSSFFKPFVSLHVYQCLSCLCFRSLSLYSAIVCHSPILVLFLVLSLLVVFMFRILLFVLFTIFILYVVLFIFIICTPTSLVIVRIVFSLLL